MRTRFKQQICKILSRRAGSNGAGSNGAQSASTDIGPLICVGMVRNEMDILELWVGHLVSLFDQVILYDHLSTDGTRQRLAELAAQNHKLEVRHYDEPGYDQSGLMTKTFVQISRDISDGWLFFLDADEFIMAVDANSFRAQLADFVAATTIVMPWCNAYTSDAGGQTISADTAIAGWRERSNGFYKVALNLKFSRHIKTIRQGNHSVAYRKRPFLRKIPAFDMLHLPIRSPEQIATKLSVGVAANAVSDHKQDYADHWRKMAEVDVMTDLKFHSYNYGISGPKAVAPPLEEFDGKLADLVALADPAS